MSKVKPIPPEIVDYLDYNPETGVFTWKTTPKGGIKVGRKAGCKEINGYCSIQFKRKIYRAHRLAYFIYHGVDPLEKQIDHIDGNRFNNKIDNLRLATNSQNLRNRSFQKNNKTGIIGVYWCNTYKKWVARITYKNKMVFLGRFNDKEEAKDVRIAAEKKYFGEYRNDCNEKGLEDLGANHG